MCGQIPERFREVGAAFPGTECCGDAIRTAARPMIDKNKDKNKTETGSHSLQSLRAYLRANKPNMVIALAWTTPITMLPSVQAWMEVYPGSIAPLNILVFYKSMPDLAETGSCHSSLDERRKGNPQVQQVHLHKSVLMND